MSTERPWMAINCQSPFSASSSLNSTDVVLIHFSVVLSSLISFRTTTTVGCHNYCDNWKTVQIQSSEKTKTYNCSLLQVQWDCSTEYIGWTIWSPLGNYLALLFAFDFVKTVNYPKKIYTVKKVPFYNFVNICQDLLPQL